MNEQVAKSLAKQEAKREKKLLRKKAWDELHYKKPKDGEEDPTLIEEIKQAKRDESTAKGKYAAAEPKEKKPPPPEDALIPCVLQGVKLCDQLHKSKKAFGDHISKVHMRQKISCRCPWLS